MFLGKFSKALLAFRFISSIVGCPLKSGKVDAFIH